MKNMNIKQMMRKSAGYTIDQTILIVAVIAILITLIIASVGWDLLNRTSGTKFASYLKQIEEANGAFYARQGVWPHIAVDQQNVAPSSGGPGSSVKDYISVLAAPDSLGAAAITNDYRNRWKPYLNGFDMIVTSPDVSAEVRHEFGNGGLIRQKPDNCVDDDGKKHLIITMEDMPLTEILNADEAIDGEVDPLKGRMTYTDLVTQIQTVAYCGNLLN